MTTRIEFPFPARDREPVFGMTCACCNADARGRFKLSDNSIYLDARDIRLPVCVDCKSHALVYANPKSFQMGGVAMGAVLLFTVFSLGGPSAANKSVAGTFWVAIAMIVASAIWYLLTRRRSARLRAMPGHHPQLSIAIKSTHGVIETTNEAFVEEFLAKNPGAKKTA